MELAKELGRHNKPPHSLHTRRGVDRIKKHPAYFSGANTVVMYSREESFELPMIRLDCENKLIMGSYQKIKKEIGHAPASEHVVAIETLLSQLTAAIAIYGGANHQLLIDLKKNALRQNHSPEASLVYESMIESAHIMIDKNTASSEEP